MKFSVPTALMVGFIGSVMFFSNFGDIWVAMFISALIVGIPAAVYYGIRYIVRKIRHKGD